MPVDHERRAGRAWPILTALAQSEGRTITYGGLATKIDANRRNLSPTLDLILHHCRHEGWPPLAGLVVQAKTGRPGEGFPAEERSQIPKVYGFDWASIDNPFESARFG